MSCIQRDKRTWPRCLHWHGCVACFGWRVRVLLTFSEVKEHADEGMILDCRGRELDRIGNNFADQAADYGRRGVDASVTDARRGFARACRHWYRLFCHLHRYFIAIPRTVVDGNGRGSTAPNPMVWCSFVPSALQCEHRVRPLVEPLIAYE